MARFNRRLKNLLVRQALVTENVVEQVYTKADTDGVAMTQLLLDQNLIEEKALIGAIALELGVPPIDIEKVRFDTSLLEVLPQDQAEYYCVVPVSRIGNILTLAVADASDVIKLDDIRIVTGCEIRPVVSTEHAIRDGIRRAYSRGTEEMEKLLTDLENKDVEVTEQSSLEEDMDAPQADGEHGAPAVLMVKFLIQKAIDDGASDIHIEPFEKVVRVRFRTDGVLREMKTYPRAMHGTVTSRIKIMSSLDIAERRKPQDGKFRVKVAGRQIDFRVSILPLVHGEKVVLRILDTSKLALSLDSMGFETKCFKDFTQAIAAPYGMILVTGPTGSGKSTTLYSALKEMMTGTENITTVEDPVEYQLEGVNQVPVNVKQGLTFAAALRSILRQDPDIVMIGEIRDAETIEIAVKAALTGHLVLSTLHTNDSPSAIVRMVDMGVDRFMVGSSLLLVSAQRLGRRLCQHCKVPVDLPRQRLLEVGFHPDEVEGAAVFAVKGCPRCANEGYKGRFALLETMPIDEDLRRLVIDGANVVDLKNKAVEKGMISLRRAGILNVIRGVTSIEEVLNVTLSD